MGNNNAKLSPDNQQITKPSSARPSSFPHGYRNPYNEVQAAVAQERGTYNVTPQQQVYSSFNREAVKAVNIQISSNTPDGITVTIPFNGQTSSGFNGAQTSAQDRNNTERHPLATQTINFAPMAPPLSEFSPKIQNEQVNPRRVCSEEHGQDREKQIERHLATSSPEKLKLFSGFTESSLFHSGTENTIKQSERIQFKDTQHGYIRDREESSSNYTQQVADASRSGSIKAPSKSDVTATTESKTVMHVGCSEDMTTYKPLSTNNLHSVEVATDGMKAVNIKKVGTQSQEYESVHMGQKDCDYGGGRERHDNNSVSGSGKKQVTSRVKSATIKRSAQEDTSAEECPPNNFRDISIFPTPVDLFSNSAPFLRKIRTEGAYDDVEHYLDVNFRLLREDVMRPLREGLNMYLEGNNKKLKNIRVYKKTYFLRPAMIRNKIGVVVCFDPDKQIQKTKLHSCKMLLSGSLVCFSDNDFKDMLFATVLESETLLREGFVVVDLIDMNVRSRNELYNRPFVMIESKVYFEPYYHILTALQNINPSEFPMSHYIIEAQSGRHPPNYLLNAESGFLKELTISGTNVQALANDSWPKAAQLNLDESQYSAFRTALTQEFVLIQGASGTGKTFLALKVMEVLLQNNSVWNSEKTPILVICFTNYALDRFLEGVLRLTSNIVRVGGQSKNEHIKHLNLKEKRKHVNVSPATHNLFCEIKDDLTSIAASVKQLEKAIEIISNNCGIVSVKSLEKYISKRHLNSFRNEQKQLDDKIFLNWLESGVATFSVSSLGKESSELVDNCGLDYLDRSDQSENSYLVYEDEIFNRIDNDVDLEIDTESSELVNLAVNFRLSKETTSELKSLIKNLKESEAAGKLHDVIENYEKDLINVILKLKYFKENLSSNQKVVGDPFFNSEDLWSVSPDGRWFLYKHWVGALKQKFVEELQQLELTYASHLKKFEDAKFSKDYEILMKASVVGMTTTGAAYLQPLLKGMKCKIVFVEEAAEMLESHITVALTSYCQHLILIGDNKQLQPSTTVYELRQKYNLHVSLFQRMLNNGIHCETLQVQRRMRPEIARLLVPAIYPKLMNHHSVRKYEPIAGVTNNVFFLTHKLYEEEVPEFKGFRNQHEGDFLIAFCRHLIFQGYAAENITILTTYVAQLFYIEKKQMTDPLLKNVKLARVENYKGEENEIVLLSLVRSNANNDIGFLKYENRVCVALSRAKKGFYMIGNMDCLTATGHLWKKISNALKSMQALGFRLPLKCQIHSDQLTMVSSANDFKDLGEGGCQLHCNFQLPCGHFCPLRCHVNDQNHSSFRCMEPCKSSSKCKLGHYCTKRCFEDCGDHEAKVEKLMPCGHKLELPYYVDPQKHQCPIKVSVKLQCGHEAVKICHQKIEVISCTHPCENRLQCGHQCLRRCHVRHDPDHLKYQCRKPCGQKNVGCKENHLCKKACYEECSPCAIMVKQVRPKCGHVIEIPCSHDPNEVKCQMDCNRMLPCGHPCKKSCSDPCGNCQLEVVKTIRKCGHSVKVKCSVVPNPNRCNRPCERLLPCGHKCAKTCGKECGTDCDKQVLSTEPGPCGHKLTVPCNMNKPGIIYTSQESFTLCKEPCKTLLECGHNCHGTCGTCFQGRVHQGCKEECGKILICGHKCTFPCSENCPPCSKKCSHRCRHSKCSNYCGQPCTPCREKCGWQCQHKKCTRFCHELCNREPCYEPCKAVLKCGHKCIGFCGDPCPRLCRNCNHEEVTTIVFGNEDEPDARFVLLENCGHIVESRGVEKWLRESGGEITMKVCPICRTPITRTQRFMNIVKLTLKDICDVKTKVFGILNEIEKKRSSLDQQLSKFMHMSSFAIRSENWHKYLNNLKQQLLPVQGERRNQLSMMDTDSLELHIKFVQEIVMALRTSSGGLDTYSFEKIEQQLQLFTHIMETRGRYLSSQEVADINCEIDRFSSLVELCRLESTKVYKMHCNNTYIQNLYDTARKTIYSIQKFTPVQKKIFSMALTNLNKGLNYPIVISAQERQQILKAMNLKQGHWYKCPNGHVYVITECGRAMQVGKCNECGAQIGGRRHTLLPTNRAAKEMERNF